jgi:hypothetical protein
VITTNHNPSHEPVTAGNGSSHRQQSDDEDEDDGEEENRVGGGRTAGRVRKPIPSWAQAVKLLPILVNQARQDPDHVFGVKPCACNLEEIFAGMPPPPPPVQASCKPNRNPRRANYRQRGSSCNWSGDRVTWQEEIKYKRNMGFYSVGATNATPAAATATAQRTARRVVQVAPK